MTPLLWSIHSWLQHHVVLLFLLKGYKRATKHDERITKKVTPHPPTHLRTHFVYFLASTNQPNNPND
jgi:hypothetical protein